VETLGMEWTGEDPIARSARLWRRSPACLDLRTGEALDYGALDDLVGRCAALLEEKLSEPIGARVASLVRNGIEAVLMMFACERIGAIYTPLNWRLSPTELEAIAADCAPALVVYEEEFAAAAGVAFAGLAAFRGGPSGDFRAAIDACQPGRASGDATDRAALILYTSGTTGRPKGAVLSRSALFWGAYNFSVVGEVDAASVMLCDTPMFHTVALLPTTRCVLQKGGRLVISDRFTPDLALSRLGDPDLGISHFFCVPQIAQMLVEAPGYDPARLTNLKGLFTGGAPLPHPLAERLLDDGVLIVNGFGMTETCTIAGMPLNARRIREKIASSGTLAPAVDAGIFDIDGAEVATGEIGEICMRGPGLMTEYWGQPEATEKTFRDGWFRSGDAGKVDAEGYLYVVDRWKDMYISGGENVYPAEVESVLLGLDGVMEVAIIGVPDVRWGEVGCAVVVIEAGADVTAETVIGRCAAHLARYKIPTQVRFVEQLPRTGSGKVRKDVLRRLIEE